jgi:hypothetical protein
MRVEFHITQDDFVQASLFIQDRRQRNSRQARYVQPLCIIFLVLIGILNLYFFPRDRLTYIFPLVLLVWPFYIKALMPIRLRRQYRELKWLHLERTLEADADGLRLVTAEDDTRVRWHRFHGFVECDSFFLLQERSGDLLPLLPKRGLTPAQIVQFRHLIESNLPSGLPAE